MSECIINVEDFSQKIEGKIKKTIQDNFKCMNDFEERLESLIEEKEHYIVRSNMELENNINNLENTIHNFNQFLENMDFKTNIDTLVEALKSTESTKIQRYIFIYNLGCIFLLLLLSAVILRQ